MVFRKVSGGSFHDFKSIPTVEGVYTGNHQGKFGLVYDVQTTKGIATLPSSKTLEPLMAGIAIGSTVRVTRATEKKQLKNGRLGWDWTVEVDDSKQVVLK